MSILNGIKKGFFTVKDATVKHSPQILMVTGIVTFGISIYQASKATLKIKNIMEERTKTLHAIDIGVNATTYNSDGSLYSEADADEDRKVLNRQTFMAVTKAVLPTVITFGLGTTAIGAGFHILSVRYVKAMATAKTFETAYNRLYGAVEKEYGEEKAKQLANGIATTVSENGEVKTTISPETPVANPYLMYITPQSCRYWDDQDYGNELNFEACVNRFNNIGQCTRGYVLLHDVAHDLGYKKIKPIFADAGWLMSPDRIKKAQEDGLNPDGSIDLRVQKIYYEDEVQKFNDLTDPDERLKFSEWLDENFYNPKTGRYVDCIYLLDPNVDGYIKPYM